MLARQSFPATRCVLARARLAAVPMLGVLASIGVTGPATAPAAAADGWRLLVGATHFSWQTTGGVRGHTEDCRTEACDELDFNRANLDASIGIRAALERTTYRGWVELAGGVESSLLFTEYNWSQRELRLLEASVVGVASVPLGMVRVLGRLGAGGLLGDGGRTGAVAFGEGAVEIELSPALAVRAGVRRARHGRARSEDVTVSFVSTPGARHPEGAVEVEMTAGLALTDVGFGDSLGLKRAPLWQAALLLRPRGGRHRLGLLLDSAAYESRHRTVFIHTPGNERSREIGAVGIHWDVALFARAASSVRAGFSLRRASWADEREALLFHRGRPVAGGESEYGGAIGIAVARTVGPLRALVAADHVYWPRLGLGELRLRAGLAFPL